MSADPKPHKVTILWGEDACRARFEDDLSPEKAIEAASGGELTTYEFASHAELEAFLLGCRESGGWNDYEIVSRRKPGVAA